MVGLCVRGHGQRLFLRRADGRADAAAGAVGGADLEREDITGLAGGGNRAERSGRCGGLLGGQQIRTHHGVRTGERASVALDALGGIPDGHVDRDVAFLVGGQAHVDHAVLVALERAHGQVVALLGVDRLEQVRNDGGEAEARGGRGIGGVQPGFRHGRFHEALHALVDGGEVAVHHVVALCEIRLLRGGLHEPDGVVHGDDVREAEERGLQDHVDVAAEAEAFRDGDGVDEVELRVTFCERALHVCRELFVELGGRPRAVQQQRAVRLELARDVVLGNVRGVVTADKVGGLHVIGGTDRAVAEPEMRLGHAERLLRVVLEIRLGVLRGVGVDDVDRVLVRADRAVGAEAPELAADDVLVVGIEGRFNRERTVRHVVHDADRETVHRLLGGEVAEDGFDLRRIGVLRGEAVAAAVHGERGGMLRLGQHGADVQVQRIAGRAHFLAAVEHGDAFDRGGERGEEVFRGERAVQVALEEPGLSAAGVHPVDGLADGAGDGAHGDGDVFGLRVTVVIKEVVLPARHGRDLVHAGLHDAGQRVVERVVRLAHLEEDVRILHGRAEHRVFRVQRVGAERLKRLQVDERFQVGVVDRFDLTEFMRGAETVEKMQERDEPLDRGEMRHGREVHHFLRVRAGQHRKSGLAAVHHVRMVAEDGKRVRADRAGRHVQDAGEAFAGDAVHDRDHEHEALGRGEGCGERARFERTVDRADRARFGLHFHQRHGLAEHVLAAFRRPFVGFSGHRGGRGDRVNGGDFGKRVCGVGARLVAVHRDKLFRGTHRIGSPCSVSVQFNFRYFSGRRADAETRRKRVVLRRDTPFYAAGKVTRRRCRRPS